MGGEKKEYSVRVTVCEAALSESFAEVYDKGSLIDLSAAKLIVENQTKVDCSVEVEYPDGSRYANEIFILDQAGVYTVMATGELDGKEYRSVNTITVTERVADLFSYSPDGITGTYGKSSFSDLSGFLLTYSKPGIAAKYVKPIDLNTYTGITQTDSTTGKVTVKEGAKALIAMSIDPYSYGVASAEDFYIHVTDAADPENSFSVVIRSMGYTWLSYICGKAGDQDYIGFHGNDNAGKAVYHGQRGDFYTTRYGFPSRHSFVGDTTYQTAENNVLRIYYDNVEKQILAKPNNAAHGWIICDFDDPAACNGTPWEGFTSEKAYISVACGSLTKATATFPIYEVDGSSLVNESLIYESEPTILVEEEALSGVKGYSVTAPKAKAYDQYGGELETLVKAYYKQGETLYDVKVKNGKFSTERAGEYLLVYTAKDAYGNTAVKEIAVNVLESLPAIKAELVELGESYTQGKTGSLIPVCTDLDVTNVIGEYAVQTTVSGVEMLAVENGSFLAELGGEYTVTHTVIDALGRTGEVSYQVTVTVESNPVAVSAVPVYFGFIRGNSYKLAEVYAKDYENLSLGEIKADVYVNGEKLENGVYAPEHAVEEKDAAETQETVTVEYKVGEETVCIDGEPLVYNIPLKTVYKKYVRKVGAQEREATEFLMSRYFAFDGGMSANTEGKVLVLQTKNEGAATFIQPVYSNGFKVKFDIADEKNDDLSAIKNTVAYVNVVLTDSLDGSKQIKISIVAENGNTTVSVNGQVLAPGFVSGSLQGVSGDGFGLKYDNQARSLYDLNKGIEIFKLTSYADGRAFEGFSDKLYLTLELGAEEDAKSAAIQLNSINGQSFYTARIADDNYAPTVVLDREVGGSYALGTQTTIPAGKAYDVLSDVDESSFTVSVTFNGEPIKDVSGVLLQNVSAAKEYVVEFEKAGKYVVSYSLKDKRAGVMTDKEFVLRVYIDQAPVIGAVEVQKTVKKGENISLPVPTVTFADDSEENIFYIVCIEPDNQYRYVEAGESITATKTGLYEIRYLAIDAYGNHSLVEYEVICY